MTDGLESAMKAFLKAQNAGDAAGMAEAFKSAHTLCANYEEPEEKEPSSTKKPGGLAVLIGKMSPKGKE